MHLLHFYLPKLQDLPELKNHFLHYKMRYSSILSSLIAVYSISEVPARFAPMLASLSLTIFSATFPSGS